MIYYIEITVIEEEPIQLELFDDLQGEPYTIFLPADNENDIHHHFQQVHKRDDIQYKILRTFDTWEQAEVALSLPIITKQ